MHILSLGAGVQSSTMALMASCGELTPMPEAAIFADTQAEPASVYRWLDWLQPRLPFPVYRRTKGNLATVSTRLRKSKTGNFYTNASVPAFIQGKNGPGMLLRQCTRDFKLDVLRRTTRELSRGRPVIQWIGISRDEAHRMKDSRVPRITHRWPLIEKNMTRHDCLAWMAARGYPPPPRSACVFCPYHSNAEWKRLRDTEPEAFSQAVEYERAFQAVAQHTRFRGTPFLHRSLIPLDQVVFTEEAQQGTLWGNECEGLCGV